MKTVYIVTVRRRLPRDYQVCWCDSLEEAQEKYNSFLQSGNPGNDVMEVSIEKLSDGKRTTIAGVARA